MSGVCNNENSESRLTQNWSTLTFLHRTRISLRCEQPPTVTEERLGQSDKFNLDQVTNWISEGLWFLLIGGSESHLSGCFWFFALKILGGGRDLWMLICYSMTAGWVVGTITGGRDTQTLHGIFKKNYFLHSQGQGCKNILLLPLCPEVVGILKHKTLFLHVLRVVWIRGLGAWWCLGLSVVGVMVAFWGWCEYFLLLFIQLK